MTIFLVLVTWLGAGYCGAAFIYTVNVYDGSTTDSGPAPGILALHMVMGPATLIFGTLLLCVACVYNREIRIKYYDDGLLLPFSAKAEAVSGEDDL